ncbi:MAG: hypothetical protein JRJ86_14770 [Deltaproteobacteria bacterium]|nr:hypothetical protein [Deltaproteobacteria bacterium]
MGKTNILIKHSAQFLLGFSSLLILSMLLLFPVFSYAADDSLCAEVKIEIKQELTLTPCAQR